MKRHICLLLSTILTSINCLSQNHHKNEVMIDCFSPIMTASMKGYFNDEWILTPSDNYSRKYTSIGFGINYSRKIKEMKIGYRFGFVIRTVEETNNYTYFSPNQYFVDEKFTYKQNHFFNSVFIQKEENIKKLSIQLAVELPFIFYGAGKNNYYNRTYSELSSGEIYSDYTVINNQKIGSGFATGLGINIGLAYNINNSMKFGVELDEYLLYTSFTKPTNIDYSENLVDYSNSPPIEYPFTSNNDIKNNYKQIGFSRLSPRLIYTIKF
jgi:hypothetical protein